MDRLTLMDRLVSAARHAEKSAKYITEQQHTLAYFERAGVDTTRARELLSSFEELQGASTAELDCFGPKLQ